MSTHVLEIPDWHPARLNALLTCHHMKAHRLKKADAEMLAAYALRAGIPKASGRRRVRLTIVYPSRRWVADKDAYWKSLLDGLVKAGLLVDDSPRHLVKDEEPAYLYERGKKATRVELTDLPDVEGG